MRYADPFRSLAISQCCLLGSQRHIICPPHVRFCRLDFGLLGEMVWLTVCVRTECLLLGFNRLTISCRVDAPSPAPPRPRCVLIRVVFLTIAQRLEFMSVYVSELTEVSYGPVDFSSSTPENRVSCHSLPVVCHSYVCNLVSRFLSRFRSDIVVLLCTECVSTAG